MGRSEPARDPRAERGRRARAARARASVICMFSHAPVITVQISDVSVRTDLEDLARAWLASAVVLASRPIGVWRTGCTYYI